MRYFGAKLAIYNSIIAKTLQQCNELNHSSELF